MVHITEFIMQYYTSFKLLLINGRLIWIEIEIKNQVSSINSFGEQIAALTKQINSLEVIGGTANDLRDQRALLVDKLAAMVDITVREKVVGEESVGIKSYSAKMGDSY